MNELARVGELSRRRVFSVGRERANRGLLPQLLPLTKLCVSTSYLVCMTRTTEKTTPKTKLIQAWVPERLFEYAQTRAREETITLADWVRKLIQDEFQAMEIDAWPAATDPGQLMDTWDDKPEGDLRLTVLGHPLGGFMNVKMRERRRTPHRGFSRHLRPTELGETPFKHPDPTRRIVWLRRSGGFWQMVPPVLSSRDGAAVLQLKYIGLTHPDARTVQ